MQAWWKAGLGLCALGTTLRQAKSKAGFYRVDHDYVLTAAKLAQHAETLTFGFVSSLSADVSFRLFYLKVKGGSRTSALRLGIYGAGVSEAIAPDRRPTIQRQISGGLRVISG